MSRPDDTKRIDHRLSAVKVPGDVESIKKRRWFCKLALGGQIRAVEFDGIKEAIPSRTLCSDRPKHGYIASPASAESCLPGLWMVDRAIIAWDCNRMLNCSTDWIGSVLPTLAKKMSRGAWRCSPLSSVRRIQVITIDPMGEPGCVSPV